MQQKIAYIIANNLTDDPYAKKKFSAIFQQQLKKFDDATPDQEQHKILSNLKKQIDNRYLEEIPLAIANLPDKKIRERQQSYFGIFLLILGEDLILNHNTKLSKQQVVDYVIAIDNIIEPILADKTLTPQKITYKIHQQLLSLLMKTQFNTKIAEQIILAINDVIFTKLNKV